MEGTMIEASQPMVAGEARMAAVGAEHTITTAAHMAILAVKVMAQVGRFVSFGPATLARSHLLAQAISNQKQT